MQVQQLQAGRLQQLQAGPQLQAGQQVQAGEQLQVEQQPQVGSRLCLFCRKRLSVDILDFIRVIRHGHAVHTDLEALIILLNDIALYRTPIGKINCRRRGCAQGTKTSS